MFNFILKMFTGRSNTLEDRLNEMAALGQPVTLEDLELSAPFAQRVIKPMIEKMISTAQKFTPEHSALQAQAKLDMAGVSHKWRPGQVALFRYAAAAAGVVIGIFLALFIFKTLPVIQRLMVPAVGFFIGFMGPNYYLSSLATTRQKEVLKSLPDALDLLTICIEAGLGFDAAMSKVAEKWDNELSRAFSKTVQEMQLGKLRREAMRNMANSLGVPDMTSFVAAIIQADQLGVSMAKVMRIQSETMRMKRRQRAEEKGRQAPVKIMFPLVIFIFPTILIVLLGPAMLQIKDTGSS